MDIRPYKQSLQPAESDAPSGGSFPAPEPEPSGFPALERPANGRLAQRLVPLLASRYIGHDPSCHCDGCDGMRAFQILEDMHRAFGLKTVAEVVAECRTITDEQRSLAWSPEPPYTSLGAGDCRIGGNSSLDFNAETPRAKWIRARFRMRREQRRPQ